MHTRLQARRVAKYYKFYVRYRYDTCSLFNPQIALINEPLLISEEVVEVCATVAKLADIHPGASTPARASSQDQGRRNPERKHNPAHHHRTSREPCQPTPPLLRLLLLWRQRRRQLLFLLGDLEAAITAQGLISRR